MSLTLRIRLLRTFLRVRRREAGAFRERTKMDLLFSSAVFALAMFVGMLAFAEVGRRVARWRAAHDPDGAWHGTGVVDAAVFGLFGLVIAFTFSGAASRFDTRRNLIVEEVNAIGTAYLRLDILPVEAQPGLRDSFRRYLDSRIHVYRKYPDRAAVATELENVKRAESQIWTQAIAAERNSAPAARLLLPALNQMFDISTKRTMAMNMHPPTAIYAMLFGLALIASMIAGYGMARAESRAWFHVIGFAAVVALVAYLILDIEHPRLGLVRVDALDRALVDLRASMQ